MNRLTASMILSLLCVANAGTKAGSNSFSEPIRLATGDSPSAVAAADLTGDGILDLIAVHRVSDDAWVFVGDGQGGFAFLQSFAVGPFPQGIAAADLDGDQKADLATTAVPFNSGTATAWIGNGDGTFAFSSQHTADDGTRAIKIADFDRDQRPDLIVTNPTRDNVSVFLGDGDGTFGAELRTPVGTTGSYPTDLAIADFDGDGELDIATSNAQSSDASIGRLLGNGDGTFSAPTAFATSCSRPESIVTGDFNRDGQADLAVACFFSDEVAVLLGDGAGGFAAPQLYPLFPEAGNPYWILAVDLDRDGLDELVTANNGWFSVLKGRIDASFAAPQHRAAQPGTFFGAVAADFDNDGWQDLAFANFGIDELWIYRNIAGGCGGGPCPGSIAIDATPTLNWTTVPDAIGYDLIRGSLQLLRSSGGDFTTATTNCLASSASTTLFATSDLPNPSDGFWFLVREVTAIGRGSYDAFSGNLFETRDPGIAASGFDCQ